MLCSLHEVVPSTRRDNFVASNRNRANVGVKTVFIPIVIVASVFVTKNLLEYINRIPGLHNFGEIQKTAQPYKEKSAVLERR